MTPLEIEATIDQLSEQYADYLSDDQLARFWSLHRKSPDAALIYLEQQTAPIAAKHPARRTNYVKRAANGHLPQLAPWEPCPDCGEPTPQSNSLTSRCKACQVKRAQTRDRQRRANQRPAPLQQQCPRCKRWFDGPPPEGHISRFSHICGQRKTPKPPAPKPAPKPRQRNPGWLAAIGNRAKWRKRDQEEASHGPT
jgi:hypothetical protein